MKNRHDGGNGLSDDKKEALAAALRRKKQELQAIERAAEAVERGEGSGESIGENARVHLHPADGASEESLRDVSAQLAKVELREIQEIEEALDRLARGVYGVCEGCDESIGEARLVAVPETRFCIECEDDAEQENERRRHRFAERDENADGVVYAKNDYSKKGFR